MYIILFVFLLLVMGGVINLEAIIGRIAKNNKLYLFAFVLIVLIISGFNQVSGNHLSLKQKNDTDINSYILSRAMYDGEWDGIYVPGVETSVKDHLQPSQLEILDKDAKGEIRLELIDKNGHTVQKTLNGINDFVTINDDIDLVKIIKRGESNND